MPMNAEKITLDKKVTEVASFDIESFFRKVEITNLSKIKMMVAHVMPAAIYTYGFSTKVEMA